MNKTTFDGFFLRFAKKDKRVSYAASFGVSMIPENQISDYTKALLEFKRISVREDAGASIIKNLCNREAQVVLDPTLLLDKCQWECIQKKMLNIQTDSPYILTYFLGEMPENAKDYIEKAFSIKGEMKIYNLAKQNEKDLYALGPSEFIYMISHAKLILTDVVFIIRRDIEEEFKEVIGERISGICEKHGVTVDYAFQDINDIPGSLPEGRTKPWGTGQAVLAAKNVLHTPFIVINADDYYGKEGFKAVHEYLVNGGKSCMAGFVLKNTLSDNGGVTRGICKMDDSNNLTKVDETKNIVKTENGAEADGVIIDIDSLVSMNMWGLTPDFLEVLEAGFKEFFETEVSENPLKSEYLIPTFIGELLEQDRISVKVLRSNDTWYGMTYKEDVKAVKNSFRKMLEDGMYKEDLFADL